jgi:hypothetical protein
LSAEIKEEATKAWLEYGEAIKKAFNLSGFIEVEPLLRVLETEDEDNVKEFIKYIDNCTQEISNSD